MFQFQLDFTALTAFLSACASAYAIYVSRKDRRTDTQKKADEMEKIVNDKQHRDLQKRIEHIDQEFGNLREDVDEKLDAKFKEFSEIMRMNNKKVDGNLSELFNNQREIKDNYLDRFANQAKLITDAHNFMVERVHQLEIKLIERLDEMKTMVTNHRK